METDDIVIEPIIKPSRANRWRRSLTARLRRQISKFAKAAHIYKEEQDSYKRFRAKKLLEKQKKNRRKQLTNRKNRYRLLLLISLVDETVNRDFILSRLLKLGNKSLSLSLDCYQWTQPNKWNSVLKCGVRKNTCTTEYSKWSGNSVKRLSGQGHD